MSFVPHYLELAALDAQRKLDASKMPPENDDPDKGLTLEQALDALKKTRAEAAENRVKAREFSESVTQMKERLDKIDADKKAADEEAALKRGEYEKVAKEAKEEAEREKRSAAQKLAAAKKVIIDEALRARLTDAIDPKIAKLIDTSKIEVGDDYSYTGLDEIVTAFKTENPHFFKAGGEQAPGTTNKNGLGAANGAKPNDGKPVDWAKSEDSMESLLAGFKATL